MKLNGLKCSVLDRSRSFGFQAWLDQLLAPRAWTGGLRCSLTRFDRAVLVKLVNRQLHFLLAVFDEVFEVFDRVSGGKIALKF